MRFAPIQTANYPGSSNCQICVGLKRLRLAKGIIKRPQAIRTRDGFYQPPHRDVVNAFHGALLLRIVRIANYWLRVNMKSTELQRINCENENSESEALNILIFQCSLNMCYASRARGNDKQIRLGEF